MLVLANAGIPMLYFHLPAMVLALVPVIAAEWFCAQRQYRIPRKKALKGVVAANCFSALLGFPLFWLIGVAVLILGGPHLDAVAPSIRKVFEVGAGAIWLGPDASGMQIVGAGLAMLIPAFLVSVLSERWILRSAWKDISPEVIARFSWSAHFVSYPVLIVVWLCYLAWTW
jgi:hypothetical protein